MLKRSDSRGLSTIVATLLIILLTLVAVGIIWVVVRNVIQQGAEQVSLGKFTLNLEIKNVIIDPAVPNYFNVIIKRNPGKGEISGLKFIVDDGDTTEVVEWNNHSLNELEERTINLTLTSITNASNIIKVSVAPIFKLESGKEVTGDVKDVYYIVKGSSSGTGGTTCSGSNTQPCSITNGVGSQSRTCNSGTWGAPYGTCTVVSCNSGYTQSDNTCVASVPAWQTGMVSWWRFDGDANDYYGRNNGIVNGATLISTGCKSGQCYSFDGVNDYVAMNNIQNMGQQFTLSIWAKTTGNSTTGGSSGEGIGTGGGIFHESYNWGNPNSDGFFVLQTFNESHGGTGMEMDARIGNYSTYWNETLVSIDKGYPLNTWRFYTIVWNYPYLTTYLNGTLVGNTTFPYTLNTTWHNVQIGSSFYQYGLNGSIDEVMVFNRSLSPTEIQQIYSYSYP